VATVRHCLHEFAKSLRGLIEILQRIHDNCDPTIFYNRIRPFLAGSKNMAEAGLPLGVFYEESDDTSGRYHQYSGGSNAQSSLIQFFDIVLGVEHLATSDNSRTSELKDSTKADGTSVVVSISHESKSRSSNNNFILEMRDYMPGPHARFLADVAAVANISQFVHSRPAEKELCQAYDACLATLSAFRDKHIAIVYRYVVMPSRSRPNAAYEATGGVTDVRPRLNLATSSTRRVQSSTDDVKYTGTGGTSLMPFLRQVRDETAVSEVTRRFLTRRQSTAPGQAYSNTQLNRAHSDNGFGTAHPGRVLGLAKLWTLDDDVGGLCHS